MAFFLEQGVVFVSKLLTVRGPSKVLEMQPYGFGHNIGHVELIVVCNCL
jgi:hypothetical protein